MAITEVTRMTKWILGALVAVALALPARASATTIIDSGTYPYQQWVDEAKVPTPPEPVVVTDWQGPCQDALGCAERTVIYLPSGHYLALAERRKVFLHELGHVFDAQVMSEEDRATSEAILGEDSPWVWSDDSPQSPQEVFAEVYSFCARRPIYRVNGWAGLGIGIGHQRLRAECRWLRRL